MLIRTQKLPKKYPDAIQDKSSWQDVVDDCRSSVSKPPLGHDPSVEFKKNILIAEHSPIRSVEIRWKWIGIKSWIATHYARHMWYKIISTQRTDRTGEPRDSKPQDTPVIFTGRANAQNLIDTMRKRLCGQADDETRAYAEGLKDAIHGIQPELADVLVPSCVYRCGCTELTTCGLWIVFKEWAERTSSKTSVI